MYIKITNFSTVPCLGRALVLVVHLVLVLLLLVLFRVVTFRFFHQLQLRLSHCSFDGTRVLMNL
jgi:hypothetical protein